MFSQHFQFFFYLAYRALNCHLAYFFMHDSLINSKVSFKNFISVVLANWPVSSLLVLLSFLVYLIHQTLALIPSYSTYHMLYNHYVTEEIFQFFKEICFLSYVIVMSTFNKQVTVQYTDMRCCNYCKHNNICSVKEIVLIQNQIRMYRTCGWLNCLKNTEL